MPEQNPVRRFLAAPVTAPVVWLLNVGTSALWFRKSLHPVIGLAFGAVLFVLLMMLLAAARQRDRKKSFERISAYAALCLIAETSLLFALS